MKKFIAYFDILGYGERMRNKNIDDEYAIQKALREEIKEIIEKNAKARADFHTISFSDTYIFYTDDISEDAFEMIIKSSLIFMLLAAVRRRPYLPVRGAIHYGDFMADQNNSIFIGEGLRKAYEFEKNQDWMGCLISDSCYEQVKDFEAFKFFVEKQVIVNYSVPFKKDKRENKYVINIESFPRIWGNECKDMLLTKPEFIENIFVNKGDGNDGLLSLNDYATKKMKNTKEFFTHICAKEKQQG